MMNHDTIAAISTAVGEGGIAVIRVSGPDAVIESAKLFRSKSNITKAAIPYRSLWSYCGSCYWEYRRRNYIIRL